MTTPRPVAHRDRSRSSTPTPTEDAARGRAQRGWLSRQREARPWLDHLLRAGGRFNARQGDYFAAGITYYTVLALIPIVMVAFAALGFALAGDAHRLAGVQADIASSVPGSLRQVTNDLVDAAIASRSSVGIAGLLGALYGGLGWMSNIRAALTAQWEQEHAGPGFLSRKLLDLGALLGLFLALVLSVLLSALGSTATGLVVDLVGLNAVPGVFLATRLLAILMSIGATWAVFTWVIARLPREPVRTRSVARAALLAAVAFEALKQVMALYLPLVVGGPAGAVFGPVLGILVFVFFTARVVLFATAWAATAQAVVEETVPVPGPAVVTTRLALSQGADLRGVLAGAGFAVVALIGLGWRRR